MAKRKRTSPPRKEPEVSTAEEEAEARRRELNAMRSELADQYRQELIAARSKLPSRGDGGKQSDSPPKSKQWLDQTQDRDVSEYVKKLTETKEQRKYQLSLVKEFLVDPSRFGLETELIPTSTTAEEFEERKRDLNYRISLLKTLLAFTEEEHKLLLRAEAYTLAQNGEPPPS